MTNRYLLRLDDACPTMDAKLWSRVEDILDKYEVRPMVGIIPHNEDPKQQIDPEDENFWQKAKCWDQKGWAIALHGYNHCYISNAAGINPLWNRSEFASVELNVQKQKILEGYTIFKENDLKPMYFFAPSHTFDENTLVALKECSDIRIISDTIATKPYRKGDFIFIPQLGGHCTEMKINGVWTFCFHPNVMKENDFLSLESFLKTHKEKFIGFDEIDLSRVCRKSLLSRLFSFGYFTYRKMRGIK